MLVQYLYSINEHLAINNFHTLLTNFNHVGPPLAPPFNLTQRHLINDAIQHILSWSAPFTSSHFPITNYTININNHHGEYITIVKSGNDFTYIHTSYGRDCYELDFSLAANNEVGQGSAFFVLTGHPIGMCMLILYIII